MTDPGTPTLDQLRVFLAVVDAGSFAAAGRQLKRAVSVISCGIGNLEAQLGLELFNREGTRRSTLAIAGQAVLAEARAVAGGLYRLSGIWRGVFSIGPVTQRKRGRVLGVGGISG